MDVYLVAMKRYTYIYEMFTCWIFPIWLNVSFVLFISTSVVGYETHIQIWTMGERVKFKLNLHSGIDSFLY